MGDRLGELELLDQLFLQRLRVLVAEVAAPVVIARPGGVRGSARLLAPGFVGDLDLGRLGLLLGGRVAVELGVLLLGRVLLLDGTGHVALARAFRRRVERKLVLGLEHDVGLEGLADVGLQVERGQLQQPDGLLQLRGHRQLLADAELQTWFQHIAL